MNTAWRIAELEQSNAPRGAHVALLTRRLEWFKRQLFCGKAEKTPLIHGSDRDILFGALGVLD